jgi:predicted esterase YcpF (UPF0227 family)
MKEVKINVLYVHGFGSQENSRTSLSLKSILPDNVNVIAPSFSNRIKDLSKNIEKINELVKIHEIDCVIASSYGGLATLFMEDRHIKKIFINPGLIPLVELPVVTDLSKSDISMLNRYSKNIPKMIIKNEYSAMYLLSKDDDLLGKDIADAKRYLLRNEDIRLFNTSSHRATKEMLYAINDEITRIIDISKLDIEDFFALFDGGITLYDEFGDDMLEVSKHNPLFEDFQYIESHRQREKYLEEVIKLVNDSYDPIGGYKSDDLKGDLLADNVFWRVYFDEDGKITVVQTYKGKKTTWRKSFLTASKKNKHSKQEPEVRQKRIRLMKNNKDNIKKYGFFSEVSDRMETILIEKLKYPVVPIEEVQRYFEKLGKKITPTKDNHYIRKIGDDYIEKIMVGELPEELLK